MDAPQNLMGGTPVSAMLWDRIPAAPILSKRENLSTYQTNTMTLSGTDRFSASYVLQRAYEFDGTKMWANSEFFATKERAELYAIQMKPFWVDMLQYRILPTSEISAY